MKFALTLQRVNGWYKMMKEVLRFFSNLTKYFIAYSPFDNSDVDSWIPTSKRLQSRIFSVNSWRKRKKPTRNTFLKSIFETAAWRKCLTWKRCCRLLLSFVPRFSLIFCFCSFQFPKTRIVDLSSNKIEKITYLFNIKVSCEKELFF